jgi:hypothetical protein
MAVLTREPENTTEAEEERERPPEAETPQEEQETWDEEGGERRRTGVRPWILALAVVLGLLITYSVLRIAGEQRYQSCVAAVDARYGAATDNLTRLARQGSVSRCSHSPF